MATNATLITLVQSDIGALNGTQTLGHLIDLKVAAVKLGMATTAIDTQLDALDMSVADTATLMENAVGNELVKPSYDFLPKLSSLTRKVSTFGYSNYSNKLAYLAGGTALTTVLDITTPCTLNTLFFCANQAASCVLDEVKITVDGELLVNDINESVTAYSSIFYVGSGVTIITPNADFATSIISPTYRCESLKIELATLGGSAGVNVIGNVELIK